MGECKQPGRERPQRQPQPQPERQQLEQLRGQVKSDVLVAARSLCAAHKAENIEDMRDAVVQLKCMCNALMGSGQHGRVAMTDFCNALLEANGLDVLNLLQNHDDCAMAEDATFVFQKAVVLIYDIG